MKEIHLTCELIQNQLFEKEFDRVVKILPVIFIPVGYF